MSSSVSVVLLLVGIISSRAGLYIADLTVHQIFQQVSCLMDKSVPIPITTARVAAS